MFPLVEEIVGLVKITLLENDLVMDNIGALIVLAAVIKNFGISMP